jgi:hypothetical protein
MKTSADVSKFFSLFGFTAHNLGHMAPKQDYLGGYKVTVTLGVKPPHLLGLRDAESIELTTFSRLLRSRDKRRLQF